MFDKNKYVNEYIKENYKTIKVRIRKDDELIMNKLSKVDNINQYITKLIEEDIFRNHKYNYINDNVKIDFKLSKTLQDLVNRAERADVLDDYGLYMNLVDAIDTTAKTEVKRHWISESEWNKLMRRYLL